MAALLATTIIVEIKFENFVTVSVLITNINVADQTKTYEFRVENYETCDSVAFLARTWAGDPDIFVSIKYDNQNPYVDGSNYKSESK